MVKSLIWKQVSIGLRAKIWGRLGFSQCLRRAFRSETCETGHRCDCAYCEPSGQNRIHHTTNQSLAIRAKQNSSHHKPTSALIYHTTSQSPSYQGKHHTTSQSLAIRAKQNSSQHKRIFGYHGKTELITPQANIWLSLQNRIDHTTSQTLAITAKQNLTHHKPISGYQYNTEFITSQASLWFTVHDTRQLCFQRTGEKEVEWTEKVDTRHNFCE